MLQRMPLRTALREETRTKEKAQGNELSQEQNQKFYVNLDCSLVTLRNLSAIFVAKSTFFLRFFTEIAFSLILNERSFMDMHAFVDTNRSRA